MNIKVPSLEIDVDLQSWQPYGALLDYPLARRHIAGFPTETFRGAKVDHGVAHTEVGRLYYMVPAGSGLVQTQYVAPNGYAGNSYVGPYSAFTEAEERSTRWFESVSDTVPVPTVRPSLQGSPERLSAMTWLLVGGVTGFALATWLMGRDRAKSEADPNSSAR